MVVEKQYASIVLSSTTELTCDISNHINTSDTCIQAMPDVAGQLCTLQFKIIPCLGLLWTQMKFWNTVLLSVWSEFASKTLETVHRRTVARCTLCRAAAARVHHCWIRKTTTSTLKAILHLWQRTGIWFADVGAWTKEFATPASHAWVVWCVSTLASTPGHESAQKIQKSKGAKAKDTWWWVHVTMEVILHWKGPNPFTTEKPLKTSES